MALFASIPFTQAKLCTSTRAFDYSGNLSSSSSLAWLPRGMWRITVPYPFGIRQGCSRPGFNLTCDETRHPPKLFLGDGVEVDAISLTDGTMRVQNKIVNLTSRHFNGSWSSGLMPNNATISVSPKHNVFVVQRHRAARGQQRGPHPGFRVRQRVPALCDESWPTSRDTSCSGIGCCQTSIAWSSSPSYGMEFKDLGQTGVLSRRGPSGGAFIVDREWWFSGTNVGAMRNNTFDDFSGYYSYSSQTSPDMTSMPTVLDWWLVAEDNRDLVMFDAGSGWRCISLNSFAVGTGGGIRCGCSEGYQLTKAIPTSSTDAKVKEEEWDDEPWLPRPGQEQPEEEDSVAGVWAPPPPSVIVLDF